MNIWYKALIGFVALLSVVSLTLMAAIAKWAWDIYWFFHG